MDKLQQCVSVFNEMLNTEYHIIIGRKGKTLEFTVAFEISEFHHLAGLHKLNDLRIARGNRQKVFQRILSNDIDLKFLQSSRYYHLIDKRIATLSNLDFLFDTNDLVFRYNEKVQTFSVIPADFLLSTPLDENDIYIFLSKNERNGKYFCRSLFPKEKVDYTIGQPKYTLLYKEKINLSTGEKEVQYDRLKKEN